MQNDNDDVIKLHSESSKAMLKNLF